LVDLRQLIFEETFESFLEENQCGITATAVPPLSQPSHVHGSSSWNSTLSCNKPFYTKPPGYVDLDAAEEANKEKDELEVSLKPLASKMRPPRVPIMKPAPTQPQNAPGNRLKDTQKAFWRKNSAPSRFRSSTDGVEEAAASSNSEHELVERGELSSRKVKRTLRNTVKSKRKGQSHGNLKVDTPQSELSSTKQPLALKPSNSKLTSDASTRRQRRGSQNMISNRSKERFVSASTNESHKKTFSKLTPSQPLERPSPINDDPAYVFLNSERRLVARWCVGRKLDIQAIRAYREKGLRVQLPCHLNVFLRRNLHREPKRMDKEVKARSRKNTKKNDTRSSRKRKIEVGK